LGAGGSDSIPHIKKRIKDSMLSLAELIEKTQKEKNGDKSESHESLTSSSEESHSHSGNVSPRAKNSIDIGDYVMQPALTFISDKHTYKNVVFFMQDELEVLKKWSRDQSFMLSYVHGTDHELSFPNLEEP
jgi:hypothetical protein